MNPDIIIIGAGFSGLMAAYRAAERGAKVLLLAKGAGTTHWASGAIDVLGYHPIASNTPIENPRTGIERLVGAEPDHPYARVETHHLEAALAALQSVTASRGLPYVGSLDSNFLLPTPAGALKPSCLVPQSMAVGDTRRQGNMLILSLGRMRDFYPSLITANLTVQGIQARGVSLDMPEIEHYKSMTTVILAQLLDNPALRREVIRRAKSALGQADRVGFPAVLGFQRHAEVVEEFEKALGVPVFEIPTMPPSTSGFRLFEAFRATLQAKGVRIVLGSQVVRFNQAQGRVTSIETEAAARVVRHTAPQFILATGGFAGGGIVADYKGGLRETVFGLPLAAPDNRQTWFDPKFLAPHGQPIFRAGVMVNHNLQPIDHQGQVVYENVRAAGSTLAFWDAWREKSHEGVCLATGWKAATV